MSYFIPQQTASYASSAAASALVSIAQAPSHLRLVLSGVCSSTSLACWIVLLLPQLIEQWRLKSSEGISPIFIGIWFFGDVCNLVGSIWGGLLPGVVLLALWFCFADALMFFSYFYYRTPKHRRRSTVSNYIEDGSLDPALGPSSSSAAAPAESSSTQATNGSSKHAKRSSDDPTRPLLDRRTSDANGAYSSTSNNRRSSRRKSSKRARRDSLLSIINQPTNTTSSVLQQIVLPIVFVIAAGIIGYLFSSREADSQDPIPGDDDDIVKSIGPEILGYVSAVLYLGARIPQIVQNYNKKSVYGLSLLFFLFSIMGNFSYAGGILFYRSDAQYVKRYLPWLLGSLGTVFEDVLIIIQFWIYGPYLSEEHEHAIED